MAIFQNVTLVWNGHSHTIPAERMLGAICTIEDIVTFPELIAMMNGRPNMSRLSRAYGALLRYAGAIVSDEDVYDGMFKPGEIQQKIVEALNTLLAMMTPPSAIVEAGLKNGAASEGNSEPLPLKSSKPSTKRRSAASG
jgi:hypothetical protein